MQNINGEKNDIYSTLYQHIFGIDFQDDSFRKYSFIFSLIIMISLVTYVVFYIVLFALTKIILFTIIKIVFLTCVLKFIIEYLIKINKVNLKNFEYFSKEKLK